MRVTDVKIRLKEAGPLLAVAMVALDGALIINDITLYRAASGKLAVQLPRTEKAKDSGQESVVPLSGELRRDITRAVTEAYRFAAQNQRHEAALQKKRYFRNSLQGGRRNEASK